MANGPGGGLSRREELVLTSPKRPSRASIWTCILHLTSSIGVLIQEQEQTSAIRAQANDDPNLTARSSPLHPLLQPTMPTRASSSLSACHEPFPTSSFLFARHRAVESHLGTCYRPKKGRRSRLQRRRWAQRYPAEQTSSGEAGQRQGKGGTLSVMPGAHAIQSLQPFFTPRSLEAVDRTLIHCWAVCRLRLQANLDWKETSSACTRRPASLSPGSPRSKGCSKSLDVMPATCRCVRMARISGRSGKS